MTKKPGIKLSNEETIFIESGTFEREKSSNYRSCCQMNPACEITPYWMTPVASVLTRCVATGVLSQADLDTVPVEPHVFSTHLQEAEQLISMDRELDKVNLEMELLKLEKETADVTHKFYLSQRFSALQEFTSHLQDVLREQASLRQRLMKPLCQTNLPVEADLHRYVVEVIKMVVDFIGNLETSMSIVRTIPTVDDSMNKLNNGLAQLLAQVAEVEKLSKQILQWKTHHSIFNHDTSTT